MQAIILAAGMGRRLGELTREGTKCMVSVGGHRLIDRTLKALDALDCITRVLIVTGYKAEGLRAHVGERYGAMPVTYVHNPDYARTNNIYSLSLVSRELEREDTLLLESDLIYDGELLRKLVESPAPDAALVARYEPWMDGTMVTLDRTGYIASFVPKRAFRHEDAEHYYKTVNIYKFSRDFSRQRYVPFLEAYCKAMGANEYYEQVLRVLTLIDGAGMKAVPTDGAKWYEIDDVQDLDIAETLFADKEEIMRRYNQRYGGHWRFPRMLDFCYLVNPYFPTKRLRDELRASFDTLLTEYPSGMYVNSLLAAKNFGVKQEHIVVGNGAAELIKSLMEHTQGRVGIPYPTFEEYPNRLEAERIAAFLPKGDDLRYTADDLMVFYDGQDIAALLLINPDNPSGNFIPKGDVLRLAAWAERRGVRLVVDESFVDFSEGYRENSLLDEDVLTACPHLVVVKSISKSYGVPGLRLGVMASADEGLIGQAKRDVSIWNINSFAEYYMQIYGKYAADYDRACARFIEERNRFMARLAEVPFLRVLPSQANYFLCQVLPPYTSESLTRELLLRHDILIRDCGTKKTLAGRNLVRIAVRGREDNDTLSDALNTLAYESNH